MTNFSSFYRYTVLISSKRGKSCKQLYDGEDMQRQNMKKQRWKRLFLVFLILTMQIMLVSGTDQDALIRNLVEERIEIMDAFFNGSMTEKDAAAALCRVESGRLLQEDLQAFHDYFQTDLDEIMDYRVTVPKVTYRDDEVITALVCVDWKTAGLPTEEALHPVQEFSAYYSVIIEKVENSYKLVQFF